MGKSILLLIVCLAIITANAQQADSITANQQKQGELSADSKNNLKIGDKVYNDYEITGCSLEGIEINHSSGITTIKLEDWPQNKENEIAKYKTTIDTLRKKQKDMKDSEIPENATCLIFKVKGVQNGGLLGRVNADRWRGGGLNREEQIKLVLTKLGSKNKHLYYDAMKLANSGNYNVASDYERKITVDEYALEMLLDNLQKQMISETIYVTGINTEGYCDDQQVIIAGVKSGTYKYVSVNGSIKTISKFVAVNK